MRTHLSLLAIVLVLVGCAAVPQRVRMDDPRVTPLLAAAARFDRTRYGFTPIALDATDVTLESVPHGGYDAMLHIHQKTSRTIAFRKTANGYEWIGDQEAFQGPKTYTTSDGTFNEAILLTYEISKISGYPLNRLNLVYYGEDSRLTRAKTLTLKKIKPILREWGY